MAAKDTDMIKLEMKRGEVRALLAVFDIGLRVAEALALIQNTGAAERARDALTRALGPS